MKEILAYVSVYTMFATSILYRGHTRGKYGFANCNKRT